MDQPTTVTSRRPSAFTMKSRSAACSAKAHAESGLSDSPMPRRSYATTRNFSDNRKKALSQARWDIFQPWTSTMAGPAPRWDNLNRVPSGTQMYDMPVAHPVQVFTGKTRRRRINRARVSRNRFSLVAYPDLDPHPSRIAVSLFGATAQPRQIDCSRLVVDVREIVDEERYIPVSSGRRLPAPRQPQVTDKV